MSVRLHNTLTGHKEPFEPAEPGHARIYVCGPTVYDYAHLGHARCYVVYDVLVRHLRSNGLKVTYVRNITDVDDKILNRASETGVEPTDLATRFADAYAEDMHRLGNLDPDIEHRGYGQSAWLDQLAAYRDVLHLHAVKGEGRAHPGDRLVDVVLE